MSGSGGSSAAYLRAGSIPRIVSARHMAPLLRVAGLIAAVSIATPLGGCAGGGAVAPQASLAPKSEPMFPETVWGEASVRVATESERIRKSGGQYQDRRAYRVADKWYNPREQPTYDRVGIAS